MAVQVIDCFRAAHHYEAARALHILGDRMTVEDPHVLPRERGLFERIGDCAEIFRRMMLQDPDFRHIKIPFAGRARQLSPMDILGPSVKHYWFIPLHERGKFRGRFNIARLVRY